MAKSHTLAMVALVVSFTAAGVAQDAASAAKSPNNQDQKTSKEQTPKKPAVSQKPAAGSLVPLNRQKTVHLDLVGKRVLVTAKVCLQQGQLEMLVCKKQSKEHESILSVDSKAYVIHTALLALGAKTGTPVKFQPEFQPPKGHKVAIFFQWKDADGKPHRISAHKWVRTNTQRFYVQKLAKLPPDVTLPKESELRFDAKHKELLWYGVMNAEQRDALSKLSSDDAFQKLIREFHRMSQPKELNANFLFTGGGFYVDEDTGERSYLPEGGGIICVANFPSAMIDIAQKSSAQESQGLLYEAFTERIPPKGTEVTIELIPESIPAAKDRKK